MTSKHPTYKKTKHSSNVIQPLNNLHNNDTVLMQYVQLLIDKHNFMLSKFDHINNMLTNQLTTIDNRTKLLVDEFNELKDIISYECDDDYNNNNTKHNKTDNETDNETYNETYNEIDNEIDNEIENEKKIKKKINTLPDKFNMGKNEGIIIKVSDSHKKKGNMSSGFNPLELLLGQLGGGGHMQKQKEKEKENNDEFNSDDEYDCTSPIYDDNNIQYDDNFIEIDKKIENITDLIELGREYESIINNTDIHKKNEKKTMLLNLQKNNDNKDTIFDIYEHDGKKYGINLETVIKLKKPLEKLSKMIGMKKVKDDMFEMIIYFLQGFEKNNKNMMHSVIEGPPGVGKTKLGKIMAQIYCALGIISSNKFKYVKATDLIGDHVGATKHMTQEAIDSADGGVLFIDEAYALSSNDNKDPYGKECLDTLNFNLSENKKKLIVIIAGYPDYLDKYFFSFNPGLQRRFPFKFRIDSYNAEELRDIFIDKLRRFKWKFNKDLTIDLITDFFKTHKDDFPNFGGDIENLFKNCQFAHSKRIIGKHPNLRGKLIYDDILQGFNKFKKNKRDDISKPSFPHMYT